MSWEGKCVVVRYIHVLYIYIYEGRIEVVSYYEEVVKEKIDFFLKTVEIRFLLIHLCSSRFSNCKQKLYNAY